MFRFTDLLIINNKHKNILLRIRFYGFNKSVLCTKMKKLNRITSKKIPSLLKLGIWLSTTNLMPFSVRHLHRQNSIVAILVLGFQMYQYLFYLLRDTYFWKSLLNELFIFNHQ